MFNRLSFRMKLQLMLLSLSSLALVVFGFQARQGAQALMSGKESQVKFAAESLLDKIDRNLFERYGDVQAYALSEPARSGNPERITEFMTDMMAAYAPIYDMMIVTNAKGRVIAVSSVDKSGKPVKSHSLIGTDYSEKEWFVAAIKNKIKPGTSFVEDLHVDSDVAKILGNSGRVMNFTAPIRDKNTGQVVGVWSNRMSWTDVVEAITKEESEKTKNERISLVLPHLVDSNGTFLLHPQGAEFELKKAIAGFEQPKDGTVGASSLSHVEVKTPLYKGPVIEVMAKSHGYASYPARGWTSILQVPLSDSQIEANTRLTVLAFVTILFANVLVFFLMGGMSKSFERVIHHLTEESGRVKSAATRITGASQQLSEATTEQAAAIEETVSSMEEMTSMLGQTTQQASKSMSVAEDGQIEAKKGKEVISKMSAAMEDIQAANNKLDRLVGLIEEIKNKTKVINDIVFETRLLSFNASIEAARAGAHGKGFAVVAEEVGKLASMSGKAADEIRNLLDSSTQEVTLVVKGTQEQVSFGKSISQECEVAFNLMGDTLERICEATKMIASAAKEQEAGVQQTNKAMSEMDQVTQANAHSAETLADQANRLSTGADSLNHTIETLTALIDGVGSTKFTAKENPESVVATQALFNKTDFSNTDFKRGAELEIHELVKAEPPSTSSNALKRSDSRWKSAA